MSKQFTLPDASQRKSIINHINKISDGHKFAEINFSNGPFNTQSLEVWCKQGLMFDGTHCRTYYFDADDLESATTLQEFKKWLDYDLETSMCDIDDCEYCKES